MLAALAAMAALAACPRPKSPSLAATTQVVPVGRDGASLRGVAGDGTLLFVALSAQAAPAAGGEAAHGGRTATTTVEARRVEQIVWSAALEGAGGPLVHAREVVVAVIAGEGRVAGGEVRGGPGAVAVALDAKTGAARWKVAFEASDWAVASAAASDGEAVLVAGTFSGSLRVGSQVVSSGGRNDGFVARLSARGEVEWVVRVGGPGPDAVQGVAARGGRIAIAGTFSAGADLRGTALDARDPRTPNADGFVAELDARGAVRWADVFGGKANDAVAGVAIDARGRIAVAANARELVTVGSAELVAAGPADGVVAWWNADGSVGPAVLVGGGDFDGLHAIAAVGDRIVVGGFFAGALRLGDRTLTAGGGDDAFLAVFDETTVTESWPVTGEGREEINALASVPGGFVAGISHTARASVGGVALPAPRDPMSGAAVVARAAR